MAPDRGSTDRAHSPEQRSCRGFDPLLFGNATLSTCQPSGADAIALAAAILVLKDTKIKPRETGRNVRPHVVLLRTAATQARDDIRAADALTAIYPLWWLSMPAMMKGYIDRVFARGFAHESDKGVVRGLLSG